MSLLLPIIGALALCLIFEFIWFKKVENKPFALTFIFLLIILPYKLYEISIYHLTYTFEENLAVYLHVFPYTYALLIIPFVDILIGIRYIKKRNKD